MSVFSQSDATQAEGVMRLRNLPGRLRAEDGAMLIETALSFMILIAMLFALMEACMMAYTFSALRDCAREGVRYAVIHGTDSATCSGPSTGCTDSTGANVTTDVKTYASNYSGILSTMTVTPTYPDSSSAPPSRVQVTITYTYQPIIKYFKVSHKFSVSSTGRILY